MIGIVYIDMKHLETNFPVTEKGSICITYLKKKGLSLGNIELLQYNYTNPLITRFHITMDILDMPLLLGTNKGAKILCFPKFRGMTLES